MSKFNKGDKVRVVNGLHEGKVGVITNPFWQIAASDWPLVLFTDEDGNRGSADEDEMELTDDPYEYAIQRRLLTAYGKPMIVGEFWATREEVNVGLLNLNSDRYEYKLVKRKKAGPIEDAT